MRNVRGLIAMLIVFTLFLVNSNAYAIPPKIMSFHAWKSEKVLGVHKRIQTLQRQSRIRKLNPKSRLMIKQDLEQEAFNLEVAKDLTVRDYFSLYLKSHRHPNKYRLAVMQMSALEMADLLMMLEKDYTPPEKKEDAQARASLSERAKGSVN